MTLRVYGYDKCDTCRKARAFLDGRGVAYDFTPIRERPPSVAELNTMLKCVGGDLRRLFNTSGQDYRAMDLKARLPKMRVEEALELLASNGNLVKRPFALIGERGVVGFREEEWDAFLHPR